MKILVTGGCGFIGNNFVKYMLNKYPGCRIINLDKLTYSGNIDNTKDIKNERYEFVKGDICNKNLVYNLMKQVDFVVHFAAETHVDKSIVNPFIFTRTNVLGTHILLEAARKSSVKKFVHISTDEVYGSIDPGSFVETDTLNPSSPYAASKAAADLLAKSYFVTYKFPVLITRSTNNFGPYQHPEKLIPLFITNILKNKKVPLYGDGLNVRDWIYVLDNCEGIDFLLRKGEPGEIYNIRGGNEKSNIEITRMILKELGKKESFIEYVRDRPGHDRRYSLNDSKIQNLGWAPKLNFKKRLKQTIQWYRKNQEWWEKLKGRLK